MGDLQQDSWPAKGTGARWPTQAGPRHPLAAGALCVALAVGAWYGLLWGFGRTEEVGATVPRGIASAKTADTRPRPEARRVVLAPRIPSSLPSSVPAAPRGSPKPSMSKVLSDRASKSLGAPSGLASKASTDSAPRAKLSPFRQAHPWAAPAGGRYYYPSSCAATLQLPDLVFFRTEGEARDSGFESSGRPACE